MSKAIVALGILLGLWTSAGAATFTVTTSADSGPGSLRQAMVDSNASVEADGIIFSGVSGAITLESVLPALSGETSITGPGAAVLKVTGNHRSQILAVAVGAKVQISGLTLADGRAEAYLHGGAIHNAGTLTIDSCTFTNNHAYGGFGGAI